MNLLNIKEEPFFKYTLPMTTLFYSISLFIYSVLMKINTEYCETFFFQFSFMHFKTKEQLLLIIFSSLFCFFAKTHQQLLCRKYVTKKESIKLNINQKCVSVQNIF